MTPKQLQKLKAENEAAKLVAETARFKLYTKRAARATALYDATQPTTKRRQPSTEMAGEENVLPQHERHRGVAMTRDLERNYSSARAMLGQIKMNVVGCLGKLRINLPGAEEATNWFNGVYSKTCSARNDDHWSDLLQLIVAQSFTAGDCLVLIDDKFKNCDGKIWTWEADQICSLDAAEFDRKHPGWSQENGVVRDGFGVEKGYYVSKARGKQSISTRDGAVFLARGDNVRLIKRPWRLNQGRGVADLLTSANDLFDLYDARARELQSMKVAATLAGKVKRRDATDDFDNPGGALGLNLPENSGKSAAEIADQKASGGDDENYERFEALTGGIIEYLHADDDFEMLDLNRPNVNMEAFNDFVLSAAGAGLGLARAYSRLRADTSYTAFRGDMVMTWVLFSILQKWLERRFCDWAAVKVLTWAQGAGKIRAIPAGWESRISWTWPQMPVINPVDEANADKINLKNGKITFADLNGPNWREKMDALAEQIKYAKKMGLPLGIFETIGGAAPQNQ